MAPYVKYIRIPDSGLLLGWLLWVRPNSSSKAFNVPTDNFLISRED